jgi:hypothetical protein
MRIARPVVLNYVVSPYGLSILSTLIFLAAWVFPSQIYSNLIGEPDLMFFDPQTLLFVLLCVAGFWAGLFLIDFVLPSISLLEAKQHHPLLSSNVLIFPLVVTTVITSLVCIKIVKENPNLIVLLLSQQGQGVKSEFAEMKLGLLGWGVMVHPCVVWWTYWRLKNSGLKILRGRRIVSWLVIAIGVFAQVALSMLRVSRSDLMPIFGGLAVLYLMDKIRRREINTAGLLRRLLILPTAGASLFILFALLRGSQDVSKGLGDFVGYTLASYNRLAALLNGTMHYPYGGHGVFLFDFLNSNNVLNAVIPMRKIFAWPDTFELWNASFQAPQIAGLNSYLIWSGIFGYLYSDFGWTTPLIFLPYGIMYGIVWRQAEFGTTLGVTLYPWFAFSALLWFSGNLVFGEQFPFYIVAGLLLMGYERCFAKKNLIY